MIIEVTFYTHGIYRANNDRGLRYDVDHTHMGTFY